ncbi:MAG: hypothetical protein MUE99_01675 [Chitinophagaceae bacterium]|nr:hypothetical protein [Chitinophagaceae bacterium]
MKPPPKTQYRFYRPRRPGGMGDGLKLEGVSSKFGLIGLAVLMLVGFSMLWINRTAPESDFLPVTAELSSSPYRSSKMQNTVLIPFTRAKVMKLDAASLAAVDTNVLFSLKKGDILTVYMQKEEAENWLADVGKKDFYTAILLKKVDKEEWIVSYSDFRKKANRLSGQGWWLVMLAVLMLPYQLIRHPKVPIWVALMLFAACAIAFYFL